MQKIGDYLKASGKQVVLGNYTNDVTVLGTAGQVGTGLLGVDLPGDIRDITYDVTNWEWSWGHAGQTTIDVIGVLPLVGAVKYIDEAGVLLKNSDEAASALKGAGSTGRTVANNLNEQLVMKQVKSNPLNGATKVPIELKDTRWPATDGWVKMQNVVETSEGKITIHFNYNTNTGATADFKFK